MQIDKLVGFPGRIADSACDGRVAERIRGKRSVAYLVEDRIRVGSDDLKGWDELILRGTVKIARS